MAELQELYKKLENFKDFDQEGNAEKFLDTVDEIVLQDDPTCIGELLKYFDDESEYSRITLK